MNNTKLAEIKNKDGKDNIARWTIHLADTLPEAELRLLVSTLQEVLGDPPKEDEETKK